MTIKPKYSVLIRALPPDDGGGWLAVVPDLSGCSSDGETQMEALENVQDAIDQWLATAEKHGHQIPAQDDFISIAFAHDVPDEIKRQAEYMARQMDGLMPSEVPDQTLVHAIYAQIARTAIKRAHL
jgi:predicted RNase H-like HicB family nuclease